MATVLDGDRGHLGATDAVFKHVTLHVECIPANRRKTGWGVKINVTRLAHALHHVISSTDSCFHIYAQREGHFRATQGNLVQSLVEG
jgi:hypothetical protein